MSRQLCAWASLLATIFSALLIGTAGAQNASKPALSQYEEQVLYDRLFQTNLRGPRWTGNENQRILITLVSNWLGHAGLTTELLDYEFLKWDARWWSLSLTLTNGTKIGIPTTGFWPYSGDSGLGGVSAPVIDVGTYGIHDTISQIADNSTLQLDRLVGEPSIIFFDNPSPTRNYSVPGYKVLGTGRDVNVSDIPELGNLTNPHWQSAKTLDFTQLKEEHGVVGVIAQWTNTSDANAALQFLPNDGPDDPSVLYDVPSLYVGEDTGKQIRDLLGQGLVGNATIVLDAPWSNGTTSTIWGHLNGTANGTESILIYTHSDGPTIVEENGPMLLLTIAEYFAQHKPSINLDFVITTGHMSGHLLDEELWMEERPEIMQNAKAAVVCEHFGALEWKDFFNDEGKPEYKPTGQLEPMWTMTNDSASNDFLHQKYQEAFVGTSDDLRMAMISPQIVNGTSSKWYGAGGSGTLGQESGIPTLGIIPQPDYLWAQVVDGGWSKLDFPTVVEQINVILRLIASLDEAHVNGEF